MTGLWSTIAELQTSDLGTIIAESPSGQLLFGNNPRLTNAFKKAMRFTNLIDDYDDPTTFGEVAHSFAQLSSGYSNAFKAAYALKYGQKVNSLGNVTDYNVSTPEALAAMFGFETLDEANNRYVKQELYENSQDFEKDFNIITVGYILLKLPLQKQFEPTVTIPPNTKSFTKHLRNVLSTLRRSTTGS